MDVSNSDIDLEGLFELSKDSAIEVDDMNLETKEISTVDHGGAGLKKNSRINQILKKTLQTANCKYFCLINSF